LSEDALPIDLPSWITPTTCSTTGIHAYGTRIPAVLPVEQIAVLQSVGLGAVTDVDVRPAGLVAARWDGEGGGEWVSGESVVLSVSSTLEVGEAILRIDDEPYPISWPPAVKQIFVRLSDLTVGAHELQVSLISAGVDQQIAEGYLELLVRPPHVRPTSGSLREGMIMISNPVNPTLTELWDSASVVEVLGPSGVHSTIDVSLTDRTHKQLARRRRALVLPVDAAHWTSLFTREFRTAEELHRCYDEAESGLIQVSHPALGTVSLRCDREFLPLRWASGADGGRPFARLIDNTAGQAVKVEVFEFARPDRAIPIVLDSRARVSHPSGGLVTAQADTVTSSVIIPPQVRTMEDLRAMQIVPHLARGTGTVDEASALIHLASTWATASLPANPFAATQRTVVLRALPSHLAGLIGGQRWTHLEERIACDSQSVATSELESGVGEQAYQRRLAQELRHRMEDFGAFQTQERVSLFADILIRFAQRAGVGAHELTLAEFLLRAASEPASLADWPPDRVRSLLERMRASPVFLRSARFVVLTTDVLEADPAAASEGSWVWE
jgi:hypothetical protein